MTRQPARVLAALLLALPFSASGAEPPAVPGATCPHVLTVVTDACGVEHHRLCEGGAGAVRHMTLFGPDGRQVFAMAQAGGVLPVGWASGPVTAVVEQRMPDLGRFLAGAGPETLVVPFVEIHHGPTGAQPVKGRRVLSLGEPGSITVDGALIPTRTVLAATRIGPANEQAVLHLTRDTLLPLRIDFVALTDGGPQITSHAARHLIGPGEPGFEARIAPADPACTPAGKGG